ncbi:MAG TPA: hypothetical protein VM487_14995 [Phycisphaerae bacterium]|nr:hypothetical protein [Phycisphaerae bacterium]
MINRLLTVTGLVLLLALCMAVAVADAPPSPDELTENSAASWDAEADGATAAVHDDSTRVHVGSYSLRYETDGCFDTWLWAPADQNATWDLLGPGGGGPAFWVYAENPNLGFQGPSPWIRLCTTPSDYVQYNPNRDLLNEARGQWVHVAVPLNGNDIWSRTITGNPDLSDVAYVEIHADTWGCEFVLWIDGLSFDAALSPPPQQVAVAGNGFVELWWKPFVDPTGLFDHYAIYRETSPFTDATDLTPIHTIDDIDTTGYVDEAAVNGVSYYYAVTAVLSDGWETSQVESVGPRTPWDETDLQMVSISRTPRYPRYAPIYTLYEITEPSGFGPYIFTAATGLGEGQDTSTQRWPRFRDPVTYTAVVRNRGTNPWIGTLHGTWRLDGGVVNHPSQAVALQPGDVTTFDLVVPWDGQSHEVRFTIDEADARSTNNTLAIDTKSVAFLSYVDLSYIEEFRENTPSFPQAVTDDFLDWLNHHTAQFNQMFSEADCPKRVHFDVLEVLHDHDPDPDVERILFAIFPFRYVGSNYGELRTAGYYHPDDDIDYGLLHEMAHQLGLIDLYRLNVSSQQNQVSGLGYTAPAGLMNGVSPFLSQHSALAMSHWLDVAHGYYGQYMYPMPDEVRLRILGFDAQPVEGATVMVYQKVERPGLGEVITDQVKAQGTTDENGEYVLLDVPIDPEVVPPTYAGDELNDNPFGYLAVVGSNGVLHFKVEHGEFVDYAWLDITEVNNAYWLGQTERAIFECQLALGGDVQHYPPEDLAELNADQWSSWAQDGTITLSDDTDFKQVGDASLRMDATGGSDNYARYPYGLLAKWDLQAVEMIRFWLYADNEHYFQDWSVRLGNLQDGYFEWRAPVDLLNQARYQWLECAVPISGDATWQRGTFGTPDLAEINYFEIHADTWDAGFTLWIDGVGFDPRPIPGDLNGDGCVDHADLGILLADWGCMGGGCPGDCDFDGDTDHADLGLLLGHWGEGCP